MSFHNTKYCKELGCIHCGTKPKGKTSKSEMKRLKIQKATREFLLKVTQGGVLQLSKAIEQPTALVPGEYIRAREILPNEIVLDRDVVERLAACDAGPCYCSLMEPNKCLQCELQAALKGKE